MIMKSQHVSQSLCIVTLHVMWLVLQTGSNAFPFQQEHLHVLSDKWLEDRPKPLSVKDQKAISRLEEQAEEFLHAVLCRKGKS